MRRKKNRIFIITFMLALALQVRLPLFAGAAEAKADTKAAASAAKASTSTASTNKKTAKKKKKKGKYNKWVHKNGYSYYYNEKGKKQKGLKKIGKHYYLFDKEGHQRHGWLRYKKEYYFFHYTPGKRGYMARKTHVNGIYLKKTGKAKVDPSNWKLQCLIWSAKIINECTRPGWSTGEKMRAAWRYLQSRFGYWNVYYNYSAGWGVYYAHLAFTSRGGSCEGLGCVWAFLANACGASNCCCVCSGGHGWAEVNGLVYDPACARYDYYRSDYYGLPSWTWGYGGIPNYHVGCYRYRV